MVEGPNISGSEDGREPNHAPKQNALRRALSRLDSYFVPREIILRTDDQVRYLRITARSQKTVALTGVLAAIWLLSGTLGAVHLTTVVADRNEQIAQSKADYAELLDEIRDYEVRFVELTGALDANQAQLLALLQHAPESSGSALQGQDGDQPAAVANDESKFASFLDGLRGLAGQTVLLRDHVADMKTKLERIQAAKLEADTAQKQLLERLRTKDETLNALVSERDLLTTKVKELTAELDAVEGNLAAAETANMEVTARLDESTANFQDMQENRDGLQSELDKARTKLAESERKVAAARTAQDEAVEQSKQHEERIATLDGAREKLEDRVGELEEALQSAEAKLNDDGSQLLEYERNIADLEQRLAKAESAAADLRRREDHLESALVAADRRSNSITEQGAKIGEQMLAMKAQMKAMRAEQIALIKQLSERTNGSVIEAEAFLDRLRLPVEELLEEAEAHVGDGKGGPFVPHEADLDEQRGHNAVLLSNLVSLDNSLGRLEAMRELLERMPIGTPLDGYRISSAFGKRRDPINGRKAMHYGIDLVGPYRSRLEATASGVVTKAGWMAGYGRLVEIQHDFGFKTRYAHLRRISVKRGQKVERGDEVGQLGNSGRSTGPHLHYEVWFEGKRVNPYHYVKAKIDVLQK